MPAGRPEGPGAGQFVQCSNCRKTLFAAEFLAAHKVCPFCGHHHRLTWKERADLLFDEGSFVELDQDLRSKDPLEFPDYATKHEGAMKATGAADSMVSGLAKLKGQEVSTAISDFHFMGGSMGSVNGEKVTRALERGVEKRVPVIVVCASGGARMQEGLLSLMQMGKTTAAVHRCRENRIPFIAVFTDPTMAGVLASYASVADVIISEPRALIGFAGARVSKQAQVVKAPNDFQTAEFCLRSGMIDRVVERKDLRNELAGLASMLGAHLTEAALG